METNNILPKEAINEFRVLYKKRFNKDLSDQEATYRANNLFGLYEAVYGLPKKKKSYGELLG